MNTEKNKMLAFHNNLKIKEYYLSRVKAHQIADEIIQGTYWQNGKGCAVGCTLHSPNHAAYETELGIPRILARLEDRIFEGLPLKRAKLWPAQFLKAINVGANLEDVWPKFAVWLLTDKEHGVIQYAKTGEQRSAIQTVADHYSDYKNITLDMWRKARQGTANVGACSTHAAAYVAYAAAYAAYAAVDDAAAYAGYATAAYATAAYATDDYTTAAYALKKHRIAQADKLLELLKEAV